MLSLFFLLFSYLFSTSESSATILSTLKGKNVTLRCQIPDRRSVNVRLIKDGSIRIPVCQRKNCGRVFKDGNCDVVIKDLSFSDAGKYSLNVSYINEEELEMMETLDFEICVQDDVFVKAGEELKLDVLLPKADQVVYQNRRRKNWSTLWSRRDGVESERITVRDTSLIMNNFTDRDAKTYIVCSSEGEAMIMVTVKLMMSSVTEAPDPSVSASGSRENLTYTDQPKEETQMTTTTTTTTTDSSLSGYILIVGLCVFLAALAFIVVVHRNQTLCRRNRVTYKVLSPHF